MNEPVTEPKSPDPEIILYLHMRKFVGWLALALPVLTSAGYMLLGVEHWQVLDSISEYYYTFMRDVFVGTLCMVGLFLYAYKGYNPWENKVFNFAALLCVLIAFYGMDPKGYSGNFPHMFNNHILIAHHWYFEYIHLGCASVLFVILGYVSNCLFTKSDETENPQLGKKRTHKKIQRNTLYHICGWVIWISLLIYLIYIGIEYLYRNTPTGKCMDNFSMLFCVEWICLWAFGFSWLVKGEGVPFLNDKPLPSPEGETGAKYS